MIGELIALKFFGKNGWGESIKFSIYSFIGVLIVGIFLTRLPFGSILSTFSAIPVTVLSMLSAIPVNFLILKYIMKYQEKEIWKIIWISLGINLLMSVVMVVFFGSFLLGVLVGAAYKTGCAAGMLC
jgi:hypothetical protein